MNKIGGKTKIVITGGHLNPALAMIEQLEQSGRWEIYFFGRNTTTEISDDPSAESQIIPSLNIPFYAITTGRMQRKASFAGIKSLLKFPVGFLQSLYLLLKIKPHIILSFGGYLALPVCLSGFVLGISVVTHEQTTVPGIANRIVALIAKKIAVSWNIPMGLPARKTIFTGNPVRNEVRNPAQSPKIKLNLNSKLPTILIVGGNQGSHAINSAVIPNLKRLLKIANIIMQTGTVNIYNDYETASSIVPPQNRGKLCVSKFFYPGEYGKIINKADLVIGRAGANTISDLASTGKPSILIPLPISAASEQARNAQILEKFGSISLDQKHLTPQLLYSVTIKSLKSLDKLSKLALSAKELINRKSAQHIEEILLTVINDSPPQKAKTI